MPTTNIPLVTLTANQVFGPAVHSVTNLTSATLSLNRNVGSNSLDSSPTASLTLLVEYSTDGGSTWAFLISATIPGGVLFKDKAQTITQEVSSVQVNFFDGTTHVRGTVTNGPVSVSVSGSLTTA